MANRKSGLFIHYSQIVFLDHILAAGLPYSRVFVLLTEILIRWQ